MAARRKLGKHLRFPLALACLDGPARERNLLERLSQRPFEQAACRDRRIVTLMNN